MLDYQIICQNMDQLGEPCNNFWIQACGSRLLQKESCKERSYKPNWHLTWSNPPNLSFSNSLLSKAAPMTIKKHSTKKFNRSIVKDENNEIVLKKKIKISYQWVQIQSACCDQSNPSYNLRPQQSGRTSIKMTRIKVSILK